MTEAARVVAIVLAAGAGSRFGGRKLVAPLDGRPLIAHPVRTALDCGIGRVVVVTGSDGDEVEAALRMDGVPVDAIVDPIAPTAGADTAPAMSAEPRGSGGVSHGGARVGAIRNEAWPTGLASSVRCGLRATVADDAGAGIESVLLLLGDQPRVRTETIALLLAVEVDAARPIAVAVHGTGGAPNPVLVHRSAWRLADDLVGDRGFGPLIAARPELVTSVDVAGGNPDVDTRDDLDRLAAEPTGKAHDAADAGRT